MTAQIKLLPGGLRMIRRTVLVIAVAFSALCSLSAYASTVNPITYGADSTGINDATAAIQAAINSGKNVAFSAGTYLVHPTLTVNVVNGQTISGTGATLVSHNGTANSNLITISMNNCTVNGLNFNFDGSVTYGFLMSGMGNTIENCLFQGTCPQYINVGGSWNTTVTSNIFYGTGATTSTPVECSSVNGFTVTNNQFQDCGGFNIQTLWARNGTISGNVVRNPTYLSTVTAVKNQTVFTFVFPVAVIRYGLQLGITAMGNNVTTDTPLRARTAKRGR